MENVSYVNELICSYFVEQNPPNGGQLKQKNKCTLVRCHNFNLRDLGEFSFPCSREIWMNYLAHSERRLREEAFSMFDTEAVEARAAFLAEAANWYFPVTRLELKNERCALFFHRVALTEQLLKQVLLPSPSVADLRYGQLRKQPERRVQVLEPSEEEKTEATQKLSLYRAKLIRETLRRVLEFSEWNVLDAVAVKDAAAANQALELQVHSVATKTDAAAGGGARNVAIKCGIVTDPKNNKLAQLTPQEYLNLRSNDMRLMALHKYGIRVKDDRRFCAQMERLGAAAATVDLLEVKHSSPVQMIRNVQGSTKGASFILYNSARLESLLRQFDERVSRSNYGQLPALDEVDLSVLKEEEEWQLIFGYIFAFPNLIERFLEPLEQGACGTHLIVRFLSDFVKIFSVYYRRIRILTDMREHLMPLVYARIYLIKALRQVLNQTLALLDIEPVEFM